MPDAEEVHFDAAQQAKLVWILGLELLRCLEPVHELRHLLVAEVAVCSGVDAMYHLHLHHVIASPRILLPQSWLAGA